MTNYYNKLVEAKGEEAAREHMRSIRAKDKPAGGLHYTPKARRIEIAKQAARARWHNEKKSPEAENASSPEDTATPQTEN